MMSKPVTIPIEMLIDAVLKELSAAPINWLAGESRTSSSWRKRGSSAVAIVIERQPGASGSDTGAVFVALKNVGELWDALKSAEHASASPGHPAP